MKSLECNEPNIDFTNAINRAKECDQQLKQFLGIDGKGRLDNNKLQSIVKGLDQEKQKELEGLLHSQTEALADKHLAIPKAYKKFIHDLHLLAWPNFKSDPVTLELWPKIQAAKDIAPNERIALMNAASSAMHRAWKDCLEIQDFKPPLRFKRLGLSEEDKHAGVQQSQTGESFFNIDDELIKSDLQLLIHIGFHEPEHDIQARIRSMVDKDTAPPKYRDLFLTMRELFGVGGVCSPDVFSGRNLKLETSGYAAYHSTPREITAFHQGSLAELSFSEDLGIPVAPKTRSICSAFFEHIGTESKSCTKLQSYAGPKN